MPIVLIGAAFAAVGVGGFLLLRRPAQLQGGAPPPSSLPAQTGAPSKGAPPASQQTGSTLPTNVVTNKDVGLVTPSVQQGITLGVDAVKAAGGSTNIITAAADWYTSVAATKKATQIAGPIIGSTVAGVVAIVIEAGMFAGPAGYIIVFAAIATFAVISIFDAGISLDLSRQSDYWQQQIKGLVDQGRMKEAWALVQKCQQAQVPGIGLQTNPPVFGDARLLQFTNGQTVNADDLLNAVYAPAWAAYKADIAKGVASNENQNTPEALASRATGDAWCQAIGASYGPDPKDPTGSKIVYTGGGLPWIPWQALQQAFAPPALADAAHAAANRATVASITGRQIATTTVPPKSSTTTTQAGQSVGQQNSNTNTSHPGSSQGAGEGGTNTGGFGKPGGNK